MSSLHVACFAALLGASCAAAPAPAPVRQSAVTGPSGVSLDGPWQTLTGGPDDVRRVMRLQSRAFRTTRVPAVIEETVPGYDGVIWYRRTFDRPAGWTGKRVFLRVGAANYTAQVWVNGSFVGGHEGGYTPFELELPGGLRARGNQLCIRVVDPPADRDVDGMRTGPGLTSRVPAGKEGWYFNFGGIWQSVELRAAGRLALRRVTCRPRTDGQLAVEVESDLAGAGLPGAVEITVTGPDGARTLQRTEAILLRPGDNLHRFVLKIANPALWDLEHPALYTLALRALAGGAPQDCRSERFGFRDFRIRSGRFHLNGREMIVRSALVQGHYPGTLAYPATREEARAEIRSARAAGLNMLRMHLKPPHPWLLEAADEIGLLVYDEAPIGWLIDSSEMAMRCRTELREMIRRDANHPSVVIWGILNEQWSAEPGGLNARSIQSELVSLALSIDETRVLAPNSHTTMLDPTDPAPTEVLLEPHDYRPGPTRIATLDGWAALADRNSIYMGEIGVGSLPDYDAFLAGYDHRFGPTLDLQDRRFYAGGRRRVLDTIAPRIPDSMLKVATPTAKLAALVTASRTAQAEYTWEQLSALMSNPRLRGYSYTGWRDAFEECQGIYDLFGGAKPTLAVIQKLNAPNCPAIRLSRSSALPGDPLRISASLLNPGPDAAGARYRILLDGAAVAEGALPAAVTATAPVALAAGTACRAPAAPGDYRVELRIHVGGRETISDAPLAVLAPPDGPPPRLASANRELLTRLGAQPVPAGEPSVALLSARSDTPAAIAAGLAAVHAGGRAIVVLDAEGALPDALKPALPAGAALARLPDPYICTLHLAADHPILSGLGHGVLSHRKWSETLPQYALRGAGDAPIMGVFSGSWFYPAYPESFDATMIALPHGAGRLIVTTLGLPEAALRDDRLAQRLLRSACAWLAAAP